MVTFYQWCKYIIKQPGTENIFWWPVYFTELTIDNLMIKLNKSYHKISYIILFLYSVYSFIFKSTCGEHEDTNRKTLMQPWNVLFMNLSNHGFISHNSNLKSVLHSHDFLLTLWVKWPVVDRIRLQSNKFAHVWKARQLVIQNFMTALGAKQDFR